ncbi:hypothetical protein GRS66_002363 [Saccharomyces pastorianus]|uniref:Uncharacterized protein n=1 Tax=Saccharomyces pastorianus TaxID=27292 RepID=A0A6C1DSP8_SACPS|nr:hypothetical protein GRS66_002363 [Saccharomyces pastorianus]
MDHQDCHLKLNKETSETSETSAAPKTYTTATVTQCDDNGCNVKIITSQIPEATSTVTATSASQSHTLLSLLRVLKQPH